MTAAYLTPAQARIYRAALERGPLRLNNRAQVPLAKLESLGLVHVYWDMRPQVKGCGVELVGCNTVTAYPAMSVWQTATGRLHRRLDCSGGPGRGGLRSGRIQLVLVTQAQYDRWPHCRCLGAWQADADRRPGDLRHTLRT